MEPYIFGHVTTSIFWIFSNSATSAQSFGGYPRRNSKRWPCSVRGNKACRICNYCWNSKILWSVLCKSPLAGCWQNWSNCFAVNSSFAWPWVRLDSDEVNQITKEVLQLSRERDKLELTLGGNKEMGGCQTCCLFWIINKRIHRCSGGKPIRYSGSGGYWFKCNPQGVDYPIPGNDYAQRNQPVLWAVKGSVMMAWPEMMAGGGDIGAAAEAPAEPALKQNWSRGWSCTEAAPAEAEAAAEDFQPRTFRFLLPFQPLSTSKFDFGTE